MQRKEPRNLRGLVQTKDLAEYIGVPEATIRAWRKRYQDWVARGRPESKAIYVHFPDPVADPQAPDEAFLINAAAVYDVASVVRFGSYIKQHERTAGNPQWLRSVSETA
jgi:hypothetical protein